jgi:Ricin-type beta-trefoil lectin domain
MRIFKKASTTMAAAGLLAFGAVAGSGSSAFASTDQPVTACSATLGALALGLQPNCTAGDSTIDNPTSVTITVNTTSLGALLNVIPGLGEKATWTLSCVVNGNPVSVPGTYTVTSTTQSASDVIDLQSAVGSPDPGQCTISDLTATTTLALSLGALGLNPITVGAAATADTGVPGAVYANYPPDQAGAHAEVCADDTGNGNAGTTTQAYQCLSDLADQWIQLGTGQFVHNGDCLTDTGGAVVIGACAASPTNSSGQIWDPAHSSGAGELSNADGNGCLTAPSSGTIDGGALHVAACHNAVGQEWTVPNVTAA